MSWYEAVQTVSAVSSMSYVRSTNSPSFIAESEIKGYVCFCFRSLSMHAWSMPLTNIGNSRWEEEHILFPYMNADCLMKHTSTKQCKYVFKQRLDSFDNFIFKELFGTIQVCFCDKFCLLLFVLFVFLYFVFLLCCFFVVVFCMVFVQCNQFKSPLALIVRILLMERCTKLCDIVCRCFAAGRWFSLDISACVFLWKFLLAFICFCLFLFVCFCFVFHILFFFFVVVFCGRVLYGSCIM
jgi:hypothetical protein